MTTPETPEVPSETSEPIIEILSAKMSTGDLLSGVLVEYQKIDDKTCFVIQSEGLLLYLPMHQCVWWSIGDKTYSAVQKQIKDEMKEQARLLLIEARQRAKEEAVANPRLHTETIQPEDLSEASSEEIIDLRAKARKSAGLSLVAQQQRRSEIGKRQ